MLNLFVFKISLKISNLKSFKFCSLFRCLKTKEYRFSIQNKNFSLLKMSTLNYRKEAPVCTCLSKKHEDVYFSTPAFDVEIPSPPAGIFLWKFLTETESNYILGNTVCLEDITNFIEKKIGPNQTHLTFLLTETLKFCRKNYKKDPKRTSALMGTVYYTHYYFTASRWRTAEEVYFYFRESILCQSVESPPTSVEIFEPEEARDALIFFFETYIRNLPIISILHLPHYKLRLQLQQEDLQNDELSNSVEKKKSNI